MNYTDHEELVVQITQGLSLLARSALVSMEQERSGPGHDPDKSDALIRFYKLRAATLRGLREQFESAMAEQPENGV